MERLRRRHNQLLDDTPLIFIRSLMNELPWEQPLVGIKGSRGVGKSTLLLQHIKKEFGYSDKALYISLDDLYFSNTSLSDFTENFMAKGGTHLYIDEIHKYREWSSELKYIYDTYKSLNVVFTGSSMLEILNSRADLSRRALVYEMQGLSFREYLNFRHGVILESYSLTEILENHETIARNISESIKPLEFFETYLKVGYFPFYKENEIVYYKSLQEIINMILEIELPMLRNTESSIISRIKQLIYVISQSVPFKPNIKALADKIQISRKTILDYLHYLSDANIL